MRYDSQLPELRSRDGVVGAPIVLPFIAGADESDEEADEWCVRGAEEVSDGARNDVELLADEWSSSGRYAGPPLDAP